MLATREYDDTLLSIEDINNVVFGLLLAGHETTTNMSANAILTLLQHPRELGRDRGGPCVDSEYGGGVPGDTDPRSWPGVVW